LSLYVGCDLGTVSIKVAVVSSDPAFSPFGGGFRRVDGPNSAGKIFVLPPRRIHGTPFDSAEALLRELEGCFPGGFHLSFTGSGAKPVAVHFGALFFSPYKALAHGVGTLHPEADSLIEIGGENSRFLEIERDGGEIFITDYDQNGECAAGTGSFIDQQASRLGYATEEVGLIARESGRPAKIAGRCSVFAKSDMIHAQQKGATPPQILKGLCDAVARNCKSSVVKGRKLGGRTAFVGGLANNEGVADALGTIIGENFFVPADPSSLASIGAALLARSGSSPVVKPSSIPSPSKVVFPSFEKLSTSKVKRIEPIPSTMPEGEEFDAYLGVDIGSVSTNLVLIDPRGQLLHESYLRTRARPVEVVREGLKEIYELFGKRVNVLGVGTTGSGRELIGELIGADTVNDEITAHKTGAYHVADRRLDGRVDTIFEIGGQDAKFINLRDGIVVDFTMNEACAAGTGSFLEEQAEKLGINIIEEFAKIAFSSTAPTRLGERCTVYIEKDLSSTLAQGAEKRDVIAGLAYSVALNYLNRVVRGRPIGEVIFFQGGTAYNLAVASAFSHILGKEIVIPPHNGVIGAYGAALLAKEKMDGLGKASAFRGFDLRLDDISVRDFSCNGCSNLCDIKEFQIEGSKSYWGDKCSEKFRKPVKSDRIPVTLDLVALRAALLETDYIAGFREGSFGENLKRDAQKALTFSAKSAKKTAGVLQAMYYYSRHPFWRAYLEALGFEIVLSGHTTKKVVDSGVEATVAEPCLPIQTAHGHLAALAGLPVDFIFCPAHISEETEDLTVQSHACPWGQTLPFVLGNSPAADKFSGRFLSPLVHFRQGEEFVEKELYKALSPFAVNRAHHRLAVKLAYAAQAAFTGAVKEAGEKAIRAVEEAGESAVVLVGRPYNLFDPGMNMSLPSRLRRDYGLNVIPIDFIPDHDVDISGVNDNMFWNYGRRILKTALWTGARENMHIIYFTNFKCGPDSYIKGFASDAAVKPFLTLQFDAHSGDAGMLTRAEAYLDSKGLLRGKR
jgi:predicted CoA-substrate-specific enzyme activase